MADAGPAKMLALYKGTHQFGHFSQWPRTAAITTMAIRAPLPALNLDVSPSSISSEDRKNRYGVPAPALLIKTAAQEKKTKMSTKRRRITQLQTSTVGVTKSENVAATIDPVRNALSALVRIS